MKGWHELPSERGYASYRASPRVRLRSLAHGIAELVVFAWLLVALFVLVVLTDAALNGRPG